MEAVLKKVALNTYEIKKGDNKGKKFKKLDFTVDVLVDATKGEIKTRTGSMSEDYAKRYFKYCGTTTKETIGKTVDVILSKRQYEKDNEKRTFEFVKFMNLLDDAGEPIIMRKEEAQDIGF